MSRTLTYAKTTSSRPGETTTRRRRSDRRRSSSRIDTWIKWVFILLPLCIYGLFVIIPIIQLVYTSFFSWDWVRPMQFVGLDNYRTLVNDDLFWLSLSHNLQWMLAALLIPTAIGLALAILLARTKVWGRSVFQAIYFLPQMIASVIVAITWRWIYYPVTGPLNVALTNLGLDGLARGWLGYSETAFPAIFIAYSWVTYGFAMLIFRAAIDGIDEDLFDAAKIDGANWFGEIRYILLPSIRPALATVLIVAAIWSFQVFDLIFLTTRGGPAHSSMVLAIRVYQETFTRFRVGLGAAYAVVLAAVVLIPIAVLILRRRTDS